MSTGVAVPARGAEMRLPKDKNWLLSVAVGVAIGLVFAVSARAQYRVNTGNANDANNRLGSGGYNQGGNLNRGPYVGYTSQDIVTGNITAAKAFRGPVPYRNPLEFTGPAAGSGVDRFVRDSSG